MSDEKLQAVCGDDLGALSDAERLAVELADAITATPANVSDELYARLRANFDERQLMELSGQIAFENFRARLNRVFDVQSDGLYVRETGSADR